MRDNAPKIREVASNALKEIRDSRSIEPLITQLTHYYYKIREASADTLGEIRDEQALDPLIARLNDDNPDVRLAVVEALWKINNPRAVEPLIAKLDDEDQRVRLKVVYALRASRDARAVVHLHSRLNDEDASVRKQALGALAQFNDPRSVSALIAHIDDKDANMRASVAMTLGRFGDDSAVAPLVDIITTELNPKAKLAQQLSVLMLGETLFAADLMTAIQEESSTFLFDPPRKPGQLISRRSPTSLFSIVALRESDLKLIRQKIEQSDHHGLKALLEEQRQAWEAEQQAESDADDT